MLTSFNVRCEPFKYFTRIPDECRVNFYVLVDFGAVDFNVNLAGALGVSTKVAGDAVVKSHADRDEEVGLLNGVVNPGFAVHAHHAEVQRIIGRETADAEERHGDRIIARSDELLKGAHRAGNHDAERAIIL